MLIVVNSCFQEKFPANLTYYRQIFTRMVATYPQCRFVFLTSQPLTTALLSHSNTKEINIPTSTIFKRSLQQAALNKQVKKLQPALLINCQGATSFRLNIPQVLLLAETPYHLAGYKTGFGLLSKRSWKKQLDICLQKSSIVVVASQSIKKLLEENAKQTPAKIVVTGAGSELPAINISIEEKAAVKDQFSGGKEYFLCHNPLHTNQQLLVLLKAFSQFKKRQHSNLQLLLPGYLAEKNKDWQEKLATYKFRNDVHLFDGSNPDELTSIIAAAYGVVDLTNSGDCGPNILQCFECRTPLITSNTNALEWTGQDAALITTATAETISAQMMLLYKDEYLRKRLVQAGIEQLAIHNWENAAHIFGNSLEAVINNS